MATATADNVPVRPIKARRDAMALVAAEDVNNVMVRPLRWLKVYLRGAKNLAHPLNTHARRDWIQNSLLF
jgi:hypothetical protein